MIHDKLINKKNKILGKIINKINYFGLKIYKL